MAEVSQDMILEYIIRKGGLVKNVDLVKHFRKFLQVDDAQQKDRAREIFKERVNTVAYIKAEKGEKYLHLRPEFQPVGGLSRPPTGRPSASSIEDNRYNHRSAAHNNPSVSDNRSSLTSPISLTSPTSTSSGSEFSDPPRTGGSAAMSSRNDIVLHSYKPVSSPPPQSTSVASSRNPQQNSATSYSSSKPTGSVFSPPSSSLGGGLGGSDFGSSLLAELDSFGSLFESFGTGSSNSSSSKPSQPTTKSSLSSYDTGTSSGLSRNDKATKPSLSSYGAESNSSLTKADQTTKPGLSAYGSASNSSLPKTDHTSSSSLGYGAKPNASVYGGNTSASSTPAYGSGHGQTTKWSSPTYSGTSSVSKPTNTSPAKNKTNSSSNSLQSGTSASRNGPTESAGDLSDLLSAFGSTTTSSTKYTPNSSYSSTSRKNDSAGDLSELLSTFGNTSLSPSTKTQSPSPKRPAPRAPPEAYQNKTSQSPQQKATPIAPSSSRGASNSQLHEQQKPSSSGASTPRTSLGNLQQGYHQSSTPPKRVAPGIPTTGTASPKTSSSSLGSGAQSRSQLSSGGYGGPTGNSSPATRGVQPASTTNYSTSRDSYHHQQQQQQQQQQQPRQVTPPRSSFASPPPQSNANMNLSSGSSLGAQTKHTSSSGSQLGAKTDPSTINKTSSDYSSSLGFFDMELMSTFSTFGVGTSSIGAPKGGPSSSPPKKLGPTVETSTMNGSIGHRRGGSTDASSRRQGSMDMNTSAPSIRVESPTRSSESSSPGGHNSPRHSSGADSRGRSPTYTALGPGPGLGDTRGRTHSAAGSTDSLPLTGGVVLRNKDGKKVVGGSAAVRRSRNLDKNANLENMTRLSITMSTPPATRRNKGQHPPPDVAPKPYNREVPPARSREDIAMEGDDVGSITGISEQDDYWEIDPLEKEWMLAAAQANVDDIHRLIMTDSYLVNRKDFIHGYTALHWAAKHGRCDIITMLIMSGAMVDIKSNGGLTPLHLAAQSAHENAIHLLIKEHGANVNMREHGGRRPIDMLHAKVSEKTKSILSKYNTHGMPTPIIQVEQLSTFSQPHHKVSKLERSWGSVGDLIDKKIEIEKKKRSSPKLTIRKSFSFKQKKLKEYSASSSPKKDYRRENKKQKKSARPLSEAVPYRYDV